MSLKAVQQQYNEALARLQELDRAISEAVAVNSQASYIIDESSLRFQRRRHAEVVDMHRRTLQDHLNRKDELEGQIEKLRAELKRWQPDMPERLMQVDSDIAAIHATLGRYYPFLVEQLRSAAIHVSGVLQHYRGLCDRLADCEKSLQQLLA